MKNDCERSRAMEEVGMLKKLDHPFINKYVDHLEYDGKLCIVETLADRKLFVIYTNLDGDLR